MAELQVSLAVLVEDGFEDLELGIRCCACGKPVLK